MYCKQQQHVWSCLHDLKILFYPLSYRIFLKISKYIKVPHFYSTAIFHISYTREYVHIPYKYSFLYIPESTETNSTKYLHGNNWSKIPWSWGQVGLSNAFGAHITSSPSSCSIKVILWSRIFYQFLNKQHAGITPKNHAYGNLTLHQKKKKKRLPLAPILTMKGWHKYFHCWIK